MPSDLNNCFLNFGVHNSFAHYRVHQKSKFDNSWNSVQLTIELKESIEKVLASSPTIFVYCMVFNVCVWKLEFDEREYLLRTIPLRLRLQILSHRTFL